jgi:hypothetical protein
MFSSEARPAHGGAGYVPYPVLKPNQFPKIGAFERLPINMTPDEIRAMVLERLG